MSNIIWQYPLLIPAVWVITSAEVAGTPSSSFSRFSIILWCCHCLSGCSPVLCWDLSSTPVRKWGSTREGVRIVVLRLDCTSEAPGMFKKILMLGALDPTPRSSDVIGLGYSLGSRNFIILTINPSVQAGLWTSDWGDCASTKEIQMAVAKRA